MIIEEISGDILDTKQKRHVAFAINQEGMNDSGFARIVSKLFWKELNNIKPSRLGEVYTKEVHNFVFHALVCHSLVNGWYDQETVICKCFDSIPTDEPICSIAIGTGLIGYFSGAKWHRIKRGMENSQKKIIVFKR